MGPDEEDCLFPSRGSHAGLPAAHRAPNEQPAREIQEAKEIKDIKEVKGVTVAESQRS